MKRSWFGLFLLVLLLAAALLVTWVMGEVHRPVAQDLRQAAEFALNRNWDGARTLAQAAEQGWRKWSRLRLCFADHTPIEEIDGQFAQLGAFGAEEEGADFAAACLTLAQKVSAVSQAHGLSLGNVF